MGNENQTGSHGRAPGRDGQYPNGMFKYNRSNISHAEMLAMNRRDGDLFAVFQDATGEIRIEYARLEDYMPSAFAQIQSSIDRGHRQRSARDVYYIIGSTMMGRIHGYHFFDFVQLLDWNMNQLFDMRGFVEWINMNKVLFESPAEEAIQRDGINSIDLENDMAELQRENSSAAVVVG